MTYVFILPRIHWVKHQQKMTHFLFQDSGTDIPSLVAGDDAMRDFFALASFIFVLGVQGHSKSTSEV